MTYDFLFGFIVGMAVVSYVLPLINMVVNIVIGYLQYHYNGVANVIEDQQIARIPQSTNVIGFQMPDSYDDEDYEYEDEEE